MRVSTSRLWWWWWSDWMKVSKLHQSGGMSEATKLEMAKVILLAMFTIAAIAHDVRMISGPYVLMIPSHACRTFPLGSRLQRFSTSLSCVCECVCVCVCACDSVCVVVCVCACVRV